MDYRPFASVFAHFSLIWERSVETRSRLYLALDIKLIKKSMILPFCIRGACNGKIISVFYWLTVSVQESVDPGHVLLTVSLTDADADGNGGPFRLEITGDGALSFAFDSQMNLITKTRLSHSKKDVYLLMVRNVVGLLRK